ncbi:MAG: radical SAM protein [Methanomassiliicoccales archaeon]
MTLIEHYVDRLADDVASGITFERPQRIDDALVRKVDKAGLNIRIPFCALRCAYCALPGDAFNHKTAQIFIDGLDIELGLYSEYLGKIDINRIYLSGGTPSLLHREIPTILEIVEDHFGSCGKVAIEASPTDLTKEVIDNLRSAGVTQISIGVQTFDEEMLRGVLNRNVRKEQMIRTLELVMDSGFDYVNIDLMFSLPGQVQTSLIQDLKTAVDMGAHGISTYPLMVLPYTPMTKKMKMEGRDIQTGQEANEKGQYLSIVEHLRDEGYKLRTLWSFSTNPTEYEGPYEHSNFIGIGPRAWGLLGDKMTLNVPDLFDYMRRLEERSIPVFAFSPVRNYPLARLARHLYYGGVDLAELKELKEKSSQVSKYVHLMRLLGLVKRNGERLILTDKALAYGNRATKKIAMATLIKMDEVLRSEIKGPGQMDLEVPQLRAPI